MRIENALKYSNGGCSGFKPDSFYIYSVNNFSNRILIIGGDYITNPPPCQAQSLLFTLLLTYKFSFYT